MKKFISMMLSICMVCIMFTGCNNEDSKSTNPLSETEISNINEKINKLNQNSGTENFRNELQYDETTNTIKCNTYIKEIENTLENENMSVNVFKANCTDMAIGNEEQTKNQISTKANIETNIYDMNGTLYLTIVDETIKYDYFSLNK